MRGQIEAKADQLFDTIRQLVHLHGHHCHELNPDWTYEECFETALRIVGINLANNATRLNEAARSLADVEISAENSFFSPN